MKKKAILFLGIVCAFSMSAQNNTKTNEHTAQTAVHHKSSQKIITKGKTSTSIWSEDFSGGIPSGWSNAGHNGNPASPVAQALWEYRGTSTVPGVGTGSRGAWAGTAGVAGGAPIASPSGSNGFVIFDSDYLDNNGVQGAAGTGVAPTPHVGNLTTDTIDLSGNPNIQLTLHSYARYFAGRHLVAFSTDGGMTWGDTVWLHQSVPVNSSTTTDEVSVINVSNFIGNAQYAMIQFIFDGSYNEPGANGQGYYYWMIDDISIEVLPNHAFTFVEFNGAPPNDIIYSGDGAREKMGHMQLSQVKSVEFDSNILNFGVDPQTNVQLDVNVYRNGNLETTLSSAPIPILNPGDTADFTLAVTGAYTPTDTGTFTCVFSVSSDSVPSAAGAVSPADSTYIFFVTAGDVVVGDTLSGGNSLDYATFDNSFGTPQLGDDGSAIASRMIFHTPTDTVNGNPVVEVGHMDIRFSTLTVDGGDVQLEIYAATSFDFINGFGAGPLVSIPYTLNNASGTLTRFDIRQNNGDPVLLTPDSAYFFVVNMFSNAGNNLIRIANDQTVAQPGQSSIMYNAGDARWYTGFSGGSRTFSSPWIRIVTADYPNIGIEENPTFELGVYPNPSNGENITLQIDEGGSYTVELVNTVGSLISSEEIIVNGHEKHTMDFSSLARGIYVLNVVGESGARSTKLTIR